MAESGYKTRADFKIYALHTTQKHNLRLDTQMHDIYRKGIKISKNIILK